jgi:hypothetical protein
MAKNESKAVVAKPEAAPEVDVNAVAQALAAPFDPAEVKFKPQTVSGNRALAVPFVDARVIQDRLDDVLGVMGWQDSYECLPDGSVVCRLRIRLGAEWITKEDVGGQSEQPDEGDRRKAAFSDALKRAAVKFGIGRYLYRMKPQWVDYDPQKRQFKQKPTLQAVQDNHVEQKPVKARVEVVAGPAPQPVETKAADAAKASQRPMPANGQELQQRLQDYDARLAAQGLCQPGDLVAHVAAAGKKAGLGPDLTTWNEQAIRLAIEETKTFESRRRNLTRKQVA